MPARAREIARLIPAMPPPIIKTFATRAMPPSQCWRTEPECQSCPRVLAFLSKTRFRLYFRKGAGGASAQSDRQEPCLPDHLSPFFSFAYDQLLKVSTRAWDYPAPQINKSSLQFLVSQSGIDAF